MAERYVIGADGGTESLRAGVSTCRAGLARLCLFRRLHVTSRSRAGRSRIPMIGGVRSAWQCARLCKKRRSGPTRWRPSRSIPPAAAWWCWMLQASRYVRRSFGWTYARPTWRQRWRFPAIRHWRSTARAPGRFRRSGRSRRRCGSSGMSARCSTAPPMSREFQDYINDHLPARMVASICNASVRWHTSYSRPGGYQPSLLRRLGLEALLEKWPRDVLPLGEVIGGLSAAAAAHLGLPRACRWRRAALTRSSQ